MRGKDIVQVLERVQHHPYYNFYFIEVKVGKRWVKVASSKDRYSPMKFATHNLAYYYMIDYVIPIRTGKLKEKLYLEKDFPGYT